MCAFGKPACRPESCQVGHLVRLPCPSSGVRVGVPVGGGGGGWWFSFQLAPTVPAPLLCKLVGQPQCLWCGVVARGVYEALAGVVRPGGKA